MKKIVKVKQKLTFYMAQLLLDVLKANALDLLKDEKYSYHFNALYDRVQEFLDIGEAVEIVDIYCITEKEV